MLLRIDHWLYRKSLSREMGAHISYIEPTDVEGLGGERHNRRILRLMEKRLKEEGLWNQV